jgi:hypothetical protein
MVTTYDFRGSRVAAVRPPHADGECLRYRLDVVAGNAVDVVRSAGGWLYDRVMAGWEVTVLLAGDCDTRPLRILGVQALDLGTAFVSTGSPSQSLAVSAEVLTADPYVREKVLKALDHRRTEVAIWGDGLPLSVNREMTRVQHMLSAAARVFKGYALAAAGFSDEPVDPTETLLCDMAPFLPVDSELIRLG